MASILAPSQPIIAPKNDTASFSKVKSGPESASSAKLFPASFKAICLNYVAAAALLIVGYFAYLALHAYIPLYRDLFTEPGLEALYQFLIAYLVLLPFYFATFPDSYATKCRAFWRALYYLPWGRLTAAEQLALRAVAVKAFFLPLMINWGTMLFLTTGEAAQTFLSSGQFFPDGYWLVYRGLFMIDVVVFTVGYAVEHPWLKNEIRSVEPTLFGWAVALACYPPFANVTRMWLGWSAQDYPEFTNSWVQHTAAIAMLCLVGIYTWASVALCFKASNLTSRGVVADGPYRWVRHPAYISKNLVWWIGSLPLILANLTTNPKASLALFGCMAGWSAIYALRAITEERHLDSSDPDYEVYRQRVPYRFIPRVF